MDKFAKPILNQRGRLSKRSNGTSTTGAPPKPHPSPKTYQKNNFLKATVSSKAKRSISRSRSPNRSNDDDSGT